MKEISDWLGHVDIGTTMNIYAHLDISAKKNVANTLGNMFASKGVMQSVMQIQDFAKIGAENKKAKPRNRCNHKVFSIGAPSNDKLEPNPVASTSCNVTVFVPSR